MYFGLNDEGRNNHFDKTTYRFYLYNSLFQLFSATDTLKLSPTELSVHIPENKFTSGMSPIHSFNKEMYIVPGGHAEKNKT